MVKSFLQSRKGFCLMNTYCTYWEKIKLKSVGVIERKYESSWVPDLLEVSNRLF